MNARICGKLVHDVFLEKQLYRLIDIYYKVCSGVEADFETRLDNKIIQFQRLASDERVDHQEFGIHQGISCQFSIHSDWPIHSSRSVNVVRGVDAH